MTYQIRIRLIIRPTIISVQPYLKRYTPVPHTLAQSARDFARRHRNKMGESARRFELSPNDSRSQWEVGRHAGAGFSVGIASEVETGGPLLDLCVRLSDNRCVLIRHVSPRVRFHSFYASLVDWRRGEWMCKCKWSTFFLRLVGR